MLRILNANQLLSQPSNLGANYLSMASPEINLDTLLDVFERKIICNSTHINIYISTNQVVASSTWIQSLGPLLFYPEHASFYLDKIKTWVTLRIADEAINQSIAIWRKDSIVLSGFQLDSEHKSHPLDHNQLTVTLSQFESTFAIARALDSLDTVQRENSKTDKIPKANPSNEPAEDPCKTANPKEKFETISTDPQRLQKTASEWSQSEITACVEAYMRMLASSEAGQPINKSAERRRLIAGPLSKRNEGSVEYRMQNISAVLDALGIKWLTGYKPMEHVGPTQKNQILDALEHLAPGWIEQKRSRKETDKIPPNVGLDPSDHGACFIPITRSDDMLQVPKSSGINWGQRENRKNKNEAYLFIPIDCRSLFPADGKSFQLINHSTGQISNARLTQENDKALQTEKIDTLGRWLRDWIGVPYGTMVTPHHLGTKHTRARIKRLTPDTFVIEI